MGGSGNLPPYAFSAMYGTPKVCIIACSIKWTP
jgi:hypothetical protein